MQAFHEFAAKQPLTALALREFRLACYKDIETLRGRPLIIYAAKFIAAPIPGQPPLPTSIDLEDIDGFTDLINSIPSKHKSIDVLIHSPGGRPDATERLVNILRNRFDEVHFLIPHSAYSAATMLALSGDSIVLHSSATLGPIDPQINNIPARSIKRGFEKVKDTLKKEGPESVPAYVPLIQKYSLELLELCDDAERLSAELAREWLIKYMFKNEGDLGKIEEAVSYFSDYDEHKLHARPLLFNKLKDLGLKLSVADGELSQLMWEAYLLISQFLNGSAFYKLYENAHGTSYGKQAFAQIGKVQIQPPQPPIPNIPPQIPPRNLQALDMDAES